MRNAHSLLHFSPTADTFLEGELVVYVSVFLQELENGTIKLLIPTPNTAGKIGFNTDRYAFDPTCTSPKDIRHLKFLGTLFGIAMRTKKPLNLHLARPMWKLLAGMTITPDDLEEVHA